jgi:3-methyladenine DNA glycosylase AlkC
MSEKALKDFYNKSVVEDIANRLAGSYPDFHRGAFIQLVMEDLPNLALKARALAIAKAMHVFLPPDFHQSVKILQQSMGKDDGQGGIEGMGGFFYLPFLNFISLYGLEEPDFSLEALGHMTCYFSAEFDIRPFIKRYPDLSLQKIYSWAKDQDWRRRRLASEGTRPHLPWAMALPDFIIDPKALFPILHRLYRDEHQAVRRSVANHLNDISKDHPALALELAQNWWQEAPHPPTRQLLHHGLRGLRRAGDKGAVSLLGYAPCPALKLISFTLTPQRLAMGQTLSFAVSFANLEPEPIALLLYYTLYLRRQNGSFFAKKFKLLQRQLQPGEIVTLKRQKSFKPLTTRRYYPGEQAIDIMIGENTPLVPRYSFELIEANTMSA